MDDLLITIKEPEDCAGPFSDDDAQTTRKALNGIDDPPLPNSIVVVKRTPDWCILRVPRGNGPRVVEEWITENFDECFGCQQIISEGVSSHRKRDSNGAVLNDTKKKPTSILANPHNSACAQSLVLAPRHPDQVSHISHLEVIAHCLVKGRFKPGAKIQISSTIERKHCETFATCLAVVPSNSAGHISLLEAGTRSDNNTKFIVPRQVQQHLKAAGYPVLGGTRDCWPFRGEKCCLCVVGLNFRTKLMQENERVSIPVVPRIRRVMDKEERFWKEKKDTEGASANDTSHQISLPAAYLRGNADFDGMNFLVNRDVMIPRKGSESLINIAEEHCRKTSKTYIQVLDLGTGCGNLLLAAMNRLRDFSPRGLGVDMADEALLVCKQNIQRLGFADCAETWKGTFSDISQIEHDPFDVILCNPPYIKKTGGRRTLDAAVLAYEPERALFVQRENPNIHYETVVRNLLNSGLLSSKALLIFEVCKENAEAVAALMADGFNDIQTTRDSKGCIRAVHGIFHS